MLSVHPTTSAQHVHTAFGRLRQSGYRDFVPSLRALGSSTPSLGRRSRKLHRRMMSRDLSQVAAHQHARADPAQQRLTNVFARRHMLASLATARSGFATFATLARQRPCQQHGHLHHALFSFGGSMNTQFEIAVRDLTPCEVHTFDLNCFETGCAWGSCYQENAFDATRCAWVAAMTRRQAHPPELPTMM